MKSQNLKRLSSQIHLLYFFYNATKIMFSKFIPRALEVSKN